MEPDFSGYATMANRKCSDGLTITPDAFKHMDKQQVPLVWQHGHDTPENVLGHVILEHRDNGTYARGFFNDTPSGQNAKQLVMHKDINALSIYASKVVQQAKSVLHGVINEVSLVLSGANPGAKIDYVRIAHSGGDIETLSDEMIIHSGETIEHAGSDTSSLTYQDVYNTLDDNQKILMEFMLKQALENPIQQSDKDENVTTGDGTDSKDTVKEGEADKAADETGQEAADLEHKDKDGTTMTRNVFEQQDKDEKSGSGSATGTLTHSQTVELVEKTKKTGNFRDGVLAHAGEYGITNIDLLFPDAQAIDTKPEWITRKMAWVEGVINGCRKLPFSRIKSLSADLTFETARAKGYIKGNLKKEQFFTLARRDTTPKTIYKKQRLDRDDIVDITDFDVVAWMWVEMRFMLREEIARAILVGDGREVDDEDKIDETKIRPIAQDDTFYTDVITVPANTGAQDLVEAVLRGRDTYLGTGPAAYMTNAVMTDMLLSKDKMGRRLYRTKADLAAELNVTEIIEVPVMAGQQRDGGEILMIIVNLSDYAIGSTRGGEITTFDDFDIDYNQYKYLIEGRMSGALTQHKRAQVVVRGTGTLVTPTVPTFDATTGVLTVPAVTGVVYKNQDTDATLTAGAQTAIASGATISVVAVPASGYYFPHNFDADWNFTRN